MCNILESDHFQWLKNRKEDIMSLLLTGLQHMSILMKSIPSTLPELSNCTQTCLPFWSHLGPIFVLKAFFFFKCSLHSCYPTPGRMRSVNWTIPCNACLFILKLTNFIWCMLVLESLTRSCLWLSSRRELIAIIISQQKIASLASIGY